MEVSSAVESFSALAQPTRLGVVKLLVRAGPQGMPAGRIADAVGAPASTLSTHLAVLERAGLISSRRQSRLIYYAAELAGLANLLGYLIEDCCEGHPEVCAPVTKAPQRATACCG